MWEYYLALSEAGFATGISQDLQIAHGAAPGRTDRPTLDGTNVLSHRLGAADREVPRTPVQPVRSGAVRCGPVAS